MFDDEVTLHFVDHIVKFFVHFLFIYIMLKSLNIYFIIKKLDHKVEMKYVDDW